VQLGVKCAAARPFGLRQCFAEDRNGVIGIAHFGLSLGQGNLEQPIE
jgi:hypothetical protein